ncbi:MAG: RagB/SusD family nutrient uptake outer membrane protein [Bacteroidales bacterium]|nr:RagB/SusD family nutrient uptake outer membrane protein [Bacteroidales bacterium]
MKAKYYLVALAVAALSFSSCDQDLLNIPQKGVESEANFYITDGDCDSAIASAYAEWRKVYTGNVGSGQYPCAFYVKNLMSDDILSGGSSRGSQGAVQELFELAITPTNDWIRLYYQHLYETVYLSNIVIEKFDAKESKIKARNIAEARGLRALAYYELVTMWGKVPLVDHVLTTTDEFRAPNVESEQIIWDFINAELEDIIKGGDLTKRNGIGDKNGSSRFTIDAARTLLGKAYMYQGKPALAKPHLQDVINSGNFKLIDNIADLYHLQANGCSEYVFESLRLKDQNALAAQNGWFGIFTNWSIPKLFSVGPDASKFYDFNATQGYGYLQVAKNLYDALVAEEGKDGVRVTSWIFPAEDIWKIGVGAPKKASCYGNEGYLRLKWLATSADEDVNMWVGVSCSTPVFKYDDVLLLAAEACFLTNDTQTAIGYVNEVRRRVQLADVTSLTFDDIKKERRLELAMDAVRFQDLKRWGDAAKVLGQKGVDLPSFTIIPADGNDLSAENGYANARYTVQITYTKNEKKDAGFTVGKDEYLPFPQNEIDVNSNLKQNPGYED